MTDRRFTLDAQPIRWELAGLAVELALLRLHLAFKRFNPLQPRVPAGHDGAGEWTSDGSLIQPAAGRERDRLSGQDLAKDPYLNRHIVDGHVGRTDQELIARLAAMKERILFGLLPNPMPRKRVGSFDSIESARNYIYDTLKNNEDEVNRVAAGLQKEAYLQTRFGYSTGREAVSIPLDTPIRIRTTYGAAIFIVHDPATERGFRIITAYPENADED